MLGRNTESHRCGAFFEHFEEWVTAVVKSFVDTVLQRARGMDSGVILLPFDLISILFPKCKIL